MRRPTLIMLAGRPGVGKTTLARELAARISAVHLRIDTIEEVLRSHGTDVRDAGYRIAYDIAADNLRVGRTVIADCVNPLLITRDAWRGVAVRERADIVEIEIICSDDNERRRRVSKRGISNWQAVFARDYELFAGDPLVVDTARKDLRECVNAIVASLEQ